jgi:chromosome partitioning protein
VIVLAVANAKGGSGKTSLAVHLAAGLARQHQRVLLVDLDPQGNASTWLLGTLPTTPGAAEALRGHLRLEDAHAVPDRPGLVVLAGGPALAGVEIALAAEVAGETLLRRALGRHTGRVDYVVLDCPPALGLTVVSALVAADGVIVPLPPAFLALAGLAHLQETLDRVRERLGATARLLGVVLVAADPREAITGEIRALLRRELGGTCYRAEVRVSTAAKALPAHQRTAWDDDADPRGAKDYTAVLTETLTRLRRHGRSREGAGT